MDFLTSVATGAAATSWIGVVVAAIVLNDKKNIWPLVLWSFFWTMILALRLQG